MKHSLLLRDDYSFFIQNFYFFSFLPSSSSDIVIGIPSFLDFVHEKLATILASSNGLVLCKLHTTLTNRAIQLFICNPITGSFTFIPSLIPSGFEKDRRVIFSFECNNKDEDYTLYALESDDNQGSWSLVCKMYVPKEGLWKDIGTRFLLGKKYMSTDQLAVFYKGALHFILSESPNHEEKLLYLASYNVESGALRIFEAPRGATKSEGPAFSEYFGEPHREDVRIFKCGQVGSEKESICWVKLYDYRHFTVWVSSDNESSSSGVWCWSNILSSVGLEKLGLIEKNSTVRGFTVVNGHSLVFATNRNEVYDYDFSGKKETRLTKVCDHEITMLGTNVTLIPYYGTSRSCDTSR